MGCVQSALGRVCVGLVCLAVTGMAAAQDAPSGPKDFDGVWWTPGYDRKYRTVEGELPPEVANDQSAWAG